MTKNKTVNIHSEITMKKTLIKLFIISSFIFTFLFRSSDIYAQNTFSCQYIFGSNICVPTTGSCYPGYQVDESACANKESSECQNTVNISCISTVSDEEEVQRTYDLIGGICQVNNDGTGEFDTIEECDIARGVTDDEPSPPRTPSRIHVKTCSSGDTVIETALGCIPTDTSGFIGWILKFAIGIGGGSAFLMMAFGAFALMTSAGDPQKIKTGQEVLTSALAGLLFIIFSTFLLRLIGYNILRIPGFG